MNPLERARIGRTDLCVTRLGLGCGPVGNRARSESEGVETVKKALELGINYLDTAPMYGIGKSERRVGKAIAGRRRDGLVISSKIGRLLKLASQEENILPRGGPSSREWVFDFSCEAVLQSLDSSLSRLGVESVDILFIHDPDDYYDEAISEAYPKLKELRSQGVVKAIGAGMNQWQMELRFAQAGDFDCFLLAGRYTLLEQGALTDFLPYCEKNGISIIIGGAYNSGILASDLREGARYNYRPAPPEVLEKARRIKVVCDRYDVPLRAVALQFCLAHPAVTSVIAGARCPEQVEDNFQMVKYPIPSALWDELRNEGFIPGDAPVPQ